MKTLCEILENPPREDKPRLQREYCLNCQLNVPPIDYPKCQQQIHSALQEILPCQMADPIFHPFADGWNECRHTISKRLKHFCLGQENNPDD